MLCGTICPSRTAPGSTPMSAPRPESRDLEKLGGSLEQVQHLLSRHHLVAAMVNRQEAPKRKLVDALVQRENLGKLANVLNGLDDGATFLLPFSLSDLQEQTSTFPLERSGVAV